MTKEFVIFDFDNTIVNSLDYWYKVMDKESFKYWGSKILKDFKTKRRGLGNREIAELFLELINIKDIDVEDVMSYWYERMTMYYTKRVKLIKGVVNYIKHLKDSGYKVILSSATNADLLTVVVKHLGLDKYFDSIYTEQILGVSKKYPEYYSLLLQKLNTTPDKVFVFEDSVASITSANNLNIDTCAVYSKYNKNRLDRLESMSKMIIKNYTDVRLKELGL